MQSNHLIFQHSRSGFSILMAIGTIGVLLILVTSLAISYIRESKLSRYSYDDVIVSAAAEGEFEYAMLKVRNHRDGFQDATFSGELDGNLLNLSTQRSTGLQSQYQISAASIDQVYTLSGQQHLIIPLFAGTGMLLSTSVESRDPSYNAETHNTIGLTIAGIQNLPWTITAMSGSESVAITGIGDITASSQGSMRVKRTQCYDRDDGSTKDCKKSDGTTNLEEGDEELLYTYDNIGNVSDFLRSDGTIEFGTTPNRVKMSITDPYFILYNPAAIAIFPHFRSTTPFSLPTLTVRSTASKGDSSQVFQFVEDKSKYYDALKYGVYNTSP